MAANCYLAFVDESEAERTNERLEFHRWVDFEHVVVVLVYGGLRRIWSFASGAVDLLEGAWLLLLRAFLFVQVLQGYRSLQIDMPLHDVFFLQHLVQSAKLSISLNHGL